MEVEARKEPGCPDLGTQLIAVVKKEKKVTNWIETKPNNMLGGGSN